MGFEVVTVARRRELDEEATAAFHERRPEFIFHDPIPLQYLGRVDNYFGEFAILFLDDGHVAAAGWGVPFVWDGTPDGLPEGYRTTLVASVEDHERGYAANAFSLMAAAVAKKYDEGLAMQVLNTLIDRATQAGLPRVVAPIRPTWKPKYPQFSMAEYAEWTRDDGLSIDPWICTHQRMGATILKPAPNSVVVSGTVAEWEAWAEMPFPVSGSYFVPGALNLVEVNHQRNLAIYREDNLWVQHR